MTVSKMRRTGIWLGGRGANRRHPSRVPLRRVIGRTARALGWLVIVACTGTFLLSLVGPWAVSTFRNEQILIVTSGSMAPRFEAGDAVIIRPVQDPADLRPGQVVTFWPVDGGHLVTHRITELKMLPVLVQTASGRMVPKRKDDGTVDQRPYLITKGDANTAPDPNATPLTNVRGIVMSAHPKWGFALNWAQSPGGRAVLLGVPAALLAAMETIDVLSSWKRKRRAEAMLAKAPLRAADRWEVHALSKG